MEAYKVSAETRKLWAVELDLLRKFKEICEKYGLRYFAIGGTLLGAARHQGFIPWDDDIDLAMYWPDYKKLLEVAPRECAYPWFFQCYLTEKNGEVSNSRLRRSDTTGCTKWEYENIADPGFNKGIFIDIFPLFYVPAEEAVKAAQKASILDAWKAIRGYTALEAKSLGLRTVNPEYEQYIEIYRKYSEQYSIREIKALYLERCGVNDKDSGEVGLTSHRVFHPNLVWDSRWFAETVELPFENTTVVCPKEYDAVLRRHYGDWRTPVYDAASHEMHVFDADTPYTSKLR